MSLISKFHQFYTPSDHRLESHIFFFGVLCHWSSHIKSVTVLPPLKRHCRQTGYKWGKVHIVYIQDPVGGADILFKVNQNYIFFMTFLPIKDTQATW